MLPVQVALPSTVSRAFLVHHQVCPIRVDADGALVVARTTTAPREGLDELAKAYSLRVRPLDVSDHEFERLLERLTAGSGAPADADGSVEIELPTGAAAAAADVRNLVNQAPVVRYVNLLVREAYAAGASDIHLEASETGLHARLRLDGELTEFLAAPAQLQHAVVSRIKLLADLDIADRRRPQDGRIRVRLDAREVDVRVATLPTLYGESLVLRLLDRESGPSSLTELGFTPSVSDAFCRHLARAHGLVLVTGPTGSGKTSTLYASLRRRDAAREKIITIEDPIEYQLAGVTQVPVRVSSGVTFSTALRAILRQDPDVLMIGEMRDAETAQLAVQAALTGHLVLATLHTNDACSALPRLLDLGVPAFLVSATLNAVLAQRLVRRLCTKCRVPTTSHPSTLGLDAPPGTSPERAYEAGAGCEHCRRTGYRGRVGLFELLEVGEAVRHALREPASPSELGRGALRDGFVSLRVDAWNKVVAGTTSALEARRVLES